MREDLAAPATARLLAQAGLGWEPQIGDWCMVLGGAHAGEGAVGLWLVVGVHTATGLLTLVDASGRWPLTQVPLLDCQWLPSAGKLKVWARAHGYRVATGEVPARVMGARAVSHVCRFTRADGAPAIEGAGLNEAEALGEAVLRALGADVPTGRTPW